MQFLIDGHRDRVSFRMAQWPDGVAGQLITPLTNYKLGHPVFAVDNGGFKEAKIVGLQNLLRRNYAQRNGALFVAVPDKIGCHRTTSTMYDEHNHLCDGWPKAFVAQDGFDGAPPCDAIFIGGTDKFKDSAEAIEVVQSYLADGKHVHIGRVNGPERFLRFHAAGAHTCDGSGISRYDHMIVAIRESINAQ